MTTRDLAQAIARYEGFQPGTRAYRNNNPGNLRFAGQTGATGKDGQGFAIFGSEADGWRALERQIELDAGRGHTLATFFGKYAPSHENDTNRYLATVAGWLGVRNTGQRLTELLGTPSANPQPAVREWLPVSADEQLEPMTVAAAIVGAAALFSL